MNNTSGGVDSLKIDYNAFKDTGIHIWEPVYDYTEPLAISVLAICFGTIVFYFRKKKKLTIEKTEVDNNYRIQFSDTEISLLQLLIDKNKKNQRADINEVNYVLGLKHKNTGLQKKVRSDTFNSINEKFRYVSKTENPLIQSIRSEIDKRYFEYYIDKRNIEIILSYI
jgi:predicted acetyltransferase